MEPPKFPLSIIIREGTLGSCDVCGSTVDKTFFGKILGCINDDCPNYKNSKQHIRKRKLNKLKRKRFF